MDVLFLIVPILIAIPGVVASLNAPVWHRILTRVRLIAWDRWLTRLSQVAAIVSVVFLISYAVISFVDGNGGNGPTVQSPTTTSPPTPQTISGSPSPTEAVIGATSVPSTPTPTPTPTRTTMPAELSVTIASPANGDSVPISVQIKGESSGLAPGQVPEMSPPWIYAAILPLAGRDPNQDWWVQPHPLIEEDGSWDAFIFVGVEEDLPGTPFDICAIISNDRLKVGRYGKSKPPALAEHCITVTRE